MAEHTRQGVGMYQHPMLHQQTPVEQTIKIVEQLPKFIPIAKLQNVAADAEWWKYQFPGFSWATTRQLNGIYRPAGLYLEDMIPCRA